MHGTSMIGFPIYTLLFVAGVALVGYVLIRVFVGGLSDHHHPRQQSTPGTSRTPEGH